MDGASELPASTRSLRPSRIIQKALVIASVPVEQALLLVVTCPPKPKSPPTHALAQLDIALSAALLPSRRTRPAFVSGTTNSPMVSMPPSEVPMTAAVRQSTGESGLGMENPASCQQSTDAMTAYFIEEFVFLRSSSLKYPFAACSEISGMPATWHPNPASFICAENVTPDLPSHKARRNASSPTAFGATIPIPVTTTRFNRLAFPQNCKYCED